MQSNKTVGEFIAKQDRWNEHLLKLHEIMLTSGLDETIKWGIPVYTLGGKNIAGMCVFKSYMGLWFYQGVFLKDPQKKLINAQENRTKALRQLRFTDVDEIDYGLVKAFVKEAIQNHKEGKEIKPDLKQPLVIPGELMTVLKTDQELKNCFDEFTLSKQREFADYISEANREDTKLKRLEKIIPMIKEQIGLNDKYK